MFDQPKNPNHQARWSILRQQWATRKPGFNRHDIETVCAGIAETVVRTPDGRMITSRAPITLARVAFVDNSSLSSGANKGYNENRPGARTPGRRIDALSFPGRARK